MGTRFQVSFTPLSGCFSPFPHGAGALSVARESPGLEGGAPTLGEGCTCPALRKEPERAGAYGALTRCGRPFQAVRLTELGAAGPVRFRSPLLAEPPGDGLAPAPVLMSFPPGTEMFQFPGFASRPYGFGAGSRSRGGLPHSDTPGSKPARGSPGLIAACRVLRRLLAPRHPPDALLTLESPTMHRNHPRP